MSSTLNFFRLTSYGKFGLSRPDLDGNKLAKSMYLARKARDRECLSSCTKGRHFGITEIKSSLKGPSHHGETTEW